ncbi:hypothetical protein Glove_366g30 [Diversispora epigaea]|uniref:Uncharacterized protein n=1 Tax=Diversispora epigaea TaxID=1348612 RepID=A0A397H8H0_9GLOM|nr:hypothetical protein Glove_366g30 [Diversispora epigaea]
MYIVWDVAIAQFFLNSENLLKKQMKINFRKLQKKLLLKPVDGKLEVEETTEEESEEWEKSKKEKNLWNSSRLGFPQLFESPDTPDTTREENDTTGGDTEGAEIPVDGKLEVEETTEEESEEWEKSKKEKNLWNSSRLGFPQLFESPDTPDTTREENDTTGGDTEGSKGPKGPKGPKEPKGLKGPKGLKDRDSFSLVLVQVIRIRILSFN